MSTHEREYTFLRGAASACNLTNTLRALPFVREKHAAQVRGDGTPYIIHPLTMACHALALFNGITAENNKLLDDILSVCLMHDVCEDCNVDWKELDYNSNIVNAVRLLTFSVNPGETKEQAKVRYYNAILDNKTATIVKILDRCNNVSTMVPFDTERMQKYIAETYQFVIPLLEKATLRYPTITNQLFVLKYHITSMMDLAERCVTSEKKGQFDGN